MTASPALSSMTKRKPFRRLGELDRRRIRAHFEQRFTAKRMAEDYLRHYEGLVGTGPKSLSRSLAPTIALQE
jgi:hypothetical protein